MAFIARNLVNALKWLPANGARAFSLGIFNKRINT